MRFIPHIRVCALAIGAFCSLSYGQAGTLASQSVQLERPFSICCFASKNAASDFHFLAKPPKRILGLNVSGDCVPYRPGASLVQPVLLEPSWCQRSCRVCGTVYDKETPIHFCT